MANELMSDRSAPRVGVDPLKRQLGVLRRDWWVVAVSLLLGGCIALGISLTETAQYAASVTLYVSVEGADNRSDAAYQNSMASQQRVLSYAKLVKSEVVVREAVLRSGVGLSVEEAGKSLSASYAPDTVLLSVRAVCDDPQVAASLAGASASVLVDYVDKLETPAAGGSSLARLTIVSDATTNASPTSPKIPKNLGAGLLAGLFVGIAVVVIRDRFDNRLRNEEDAVLASGAPLLASIPVDSAIGAKGAIDFSRGWTSSSEAYRKLRTNLQYVNVDKPARSFLITSALEGEGKTTTCCNLASTLAEAGMRVVLVDADLRKAQAAERLSVNTNVGLTDILRGVADFGDVIQSAGGLGFDVIASGQLPPNPAELLGSERFRTMCQALSSMYDFVVVDSPPIIPVTDAAVIAGSVDGVIVVARAGTSSMPSTANACAQMRAAGISIVGVVLNGVSARISEYRYSYERSSASQSDSSAPK
ncbi:polysaccharide biosynthesis tyrosine autokinase [Gordonia sp. DT218]|uniref:polysaccharide biosynthesis tyrosine autokinase n=1 Tax=Gordonia sp. DT218 TaxID=3416659 RepID=UPI003CEDEFD8